MCKYIILGTLAGFALAYHVSQFQPAYTCAADLADGNGLGVHYVCRR
jgi:hypothetical protein